MVLELTVGFETNILKNSKRKLEDYKDLIKRLKETYDVKYVDLCMVAIGVIGKDSKGLQDSLIIWECQRMRVLTLYEESSMCV